MILYWAWPPDGSGHATRAAAICRHVTREVLVVRGIDDPVINRALDYYDIPYVSFPTRQEGYAFVEKNRRYPLVLDDAPGRLDRLASLYLWRLNRRERAHASVPTLRLEGPGSLWPILMLDRDEVLSREEAREDLGLDQDANIVMGIRSLARYGAIEDHPDVNFLMPTDKYPAMRWMYAADHIVGCPGANLYAEVTYLGIPVTWVCAPNSPDQVVRMRAMGDWAAHPNAAREIAKVIDTLHR